MIQRSDVQRLVQEAVADERLRMTAISAPVRRVLSQDDANVESRVQQAMADEHMWIETAIRRGEDFARLVWKFIAEAQTTANRAFLRSGALQNSAMQRADVESLVQQAIADERKTMRAAIDMAGERAEAAVSRCEELQRSVDVLRNDAKGALGHADVEAQVRSVMIDEFIEMRHAIDKASQRVDEANERADAANLRCEQLRQSVDALREDVKGARCLEPADVETQVRRVIADELGEMQAAIRNAAVDDARKQLEPYVAQLRRAGEQQAAAAAAVAVEAARLRQRPQRPDGVDDVKRRVAALERRCGGTWVDAETVSALDNRVNSLERDAKAAQTLTATLDHTFGARLAELEQAADTAKRGKETLRCRQDVATPSSTRPAAATLASHPRVPRNWLATLPAGHTGRACPPTHSSGSRHSSGSTTSRRCWRCGRAHVRRLPALAA